MPGRCQKQWWGRSAIKKCCVERRGCILETHGSSDPQIGLVRPTQHPKGICRNASKLGKEVASKATKGLSP